MGRKGNYAEKPKKGPGKKSRKQQDPVFPNSLKFDRDPSKKLSSRQKKRAAKRDVVEEKKVASKINKKLKKQTRELYESDSDDDLPQTLLKTKNEAMKKKPLQNGKKAMAEEKVKKLGKNLPKPTVIKVQQNSAGESDEDEDNDSDGSNASMQFEEQSGSGSEQGSDVEEDSDDEEPLVSKLNDLFAASDEDEQQNSDDDDEEQSDSDPDRSDDDDEDDLPIEKASRRLKKIVEAEAKSSKAELESSMANREAFEFPEETEQATTEAVSLADVQLRIRDVTGVLSDFSKNRDPNRTRTEYLDLLRKDLCLYYSYNEFLMNAFINIFPISELMEFLEASEVQRPLTIRTNTLKIRRRDLAQALINRGVNLDPVGKWSKIGLVVYSSSVPMGATPEYLSGYYMIQGASSMLPVMALDPRENERILDMCAAPGGKSSHIAALMKNTGTLFSNDLKRDRIHGVIGNFHRLGVVNSVVSCVDGTTYSKFMTGFDRVLLDAPCTGTGVVAKDTSVKTSKSATDVQRCYNLQRKLILTAIDCLSAKSASGGYLVYSTCSILPEENEWVVDYALRKRNVRLVKTGLDFGVEGFTNYNGQRYHPTMKLTRRYYPHTHNMDGFFVAKLQKFSDAIPQTVDDEEDEVVADPDATETPAEGGEEEMKIPKKIKKSDWYFEEVREKRKKAKEDPNHVTKVFEIPVVNRKRKINKKLKQQEQQGKDNTEEPVEKIQVDTPERPKAVPRTTPKKVNGRQPSPNKKPKETSTLAKSQAQQTPQKQKTPKNKVKTPSNNKSPAKNSPKSPKSPKPNERLDKKFNKFEKKSPKTGTSYKQFKSPQQKLTLDNISMTTATKMKKQFNNNKKDKVKRLQTKPKPFGKKQK